jgi:hypothetical protein
MLNEPRLQPEPVTSDAPQLAPGPKPLVRFLSTGAGSYHWLADCPMLLTDVWHGGSLSSADAPPANAWDANRVRRVIIDDLPGYAPFAERPPVDELPPPESTFLCGVCEQHDPMPAPPEHDGGEWCVVCGCAKEIHEWTNPTRWFDTGCAMAWIEDAGGCVGLVHCTCDGYQPDGTAALPPGSEADAALQGHAPCYYRRREEHYRRREEALVDRR